MADEANRIVLLGAPGSGKGTQAALLADALGIPAVSTGEMLRAAVAEGSKLGRRIESVMNSGDLVDNETMATVVRERLAKADAAKGFLLDGYPRTLGQAATLESILDDTETSLDMVIQVEVPEAEIVRRALDRQREDDTEEVIKNRLRVYEKKTAPLTDHYMELGLLQTVDGNHSVDEVQEAMRAALGVTV